MKQRAILFAALSAFAATNVALAQSGTTTSTDHPKAIGTSQQTADEANRKAIQSGDKASIVRTGPTAAERASEVAAKTKEKVGRAKAKPATGTDAGTSADSNTTTGNPGATGTSGATGTTGTTRN